MRIIGPLLGVLVGTGVAGCGGDAHVELAAADAVESLAAELQLALDEYHGEVSAADDRRESAVAVALLARLRGTDAAAEQETHVADFTAALARIRRDRRVEWARFSAARENVETLREISGGLRRIALESLALHDEARRYIRVFLDQRSRSPRTPASMSN